jgi:lysozyme
MSTSQLPRGIDVSSWQGNPDWAKVAASGIRFAFTKVTEDTGYVNPTFAHNWAGIRAAGLVRGAYHFARPGTQDADDEARYFLDLVLTQGELETGDMLALDIESGSGDLGPWALEWCRTVEARVGFKPLIYTGRWFTESHDMADDVELAQYGLWLAAYQQQMPAPPAPWDVVAFWQHSSTGRVPGIVGDVDLNVFNGDASRLAFYGKPGAIVSPPAPADLSTLVGVAYHEDGVIIPALEGARASGDWSQVEAVVRFLRENNPHRAA